MQSTNPLPKPHIALEGDDDNSDPDLETGDLKQQPAYCII